jgi:hypothetical protein
MKFELKKAGKKIEKKSESLEEIYERDLLPLLKIMQPEGEDFKEYEESVMEELKSNVERMQNIENRATASPEEALKEMKVLLKQKCSNILEDYHKEKYGKDKNKIDPILVKKAKIVLLAEKDLSDWQKYSKDDIYETTPSSIIEYYLEAKKNRWYSSNNSDVEDCRLTDAEVSGLIRGGLGVVFSKIGSYNYGDYIKETPDELLQFLVQNNNNELRLSDILENYQSPVGYSRETFKILLAKNQDYAVIKNINLFEKSINEQDVEELIAAYSPEYPYHLNDLLEYLKKLGWPEEQKNKVIDFAFKHQKIVDNGYQKILEGEILEKYKKIDDDIKEIIDINYSHIKPEDLAPAALTKLKNYITDGHMTFFHEYYEYITYFSKTDYTWLLDQAIKNNQESLLLSVRGDGNLVKPEDQNIYAEKLISQGKSNILETLINKGGRFDDNSLSPDVYRALLEYGCVAPLKYFTNLSEESFVKILEIHPAVLNEQNLFFDIDRFNLGGTEKLKDYKDYQELVIFVKNLFGLKNNKNIYFDLPLDFVRVKGADLEKIKDDLVKKVVIVKSKLTSLYPNTSASDPSARMELFNYEFGLKMLNKTEGELKKYLDAMDYLPDRLRKGNPETFLKAVDSIEDFSSEEKTKVSNNIKKMVLIFDPNSQKDFFNRYLEQLGGADANEGLSDTFWNCSIIPDYIDFYNKLGAQDKKTFQNIFPWSDALIKIKDKFRIKNDAESSNSPENKRTKTSFVSLLQAITKDGALDLTNSADGELVVNFAERFGVDGPPKLFELFAKIARCSKISELGPETLVELKNNFKIEIDRETEIGVILDKIEKVYQEIFTNNMALCKSQFDTGENAGRGYSEKEPAYDYLKTLALNGDLKNQDNKLLINFFEAYIKVDKENSQRQFDYFANSHELFPPEKWGLNLVAYINVAENIRATDSDFKEKITELFSLSGTYRDECFKELRGEWMEFLKNQELSLPLNLAVVAGTVDNGGGAGNLKYVESLGDLMSQVHKAMGNKKTVDRTKFEIKEILFKAEERFDKDKWSQDDRANFYNLSKDIIEAAPSLYSAFAPVMEQVPGKDLKTMLKEILPLYQVELITIQKVEGQDGEVSYNPRDLVSIKTALTMLAAQLKITPENKDEILADEKQRLIEVMQKGFKKRFGLIQIPKEFNKEHLRSVQNCVRYAGNISGRNEEREDLIAFYLGLELNHDWEKFRQGQEVDVAKYLDKKQLEIIKPILEKKKANSLPWEILGIEESEVPKFQQILQNDVLGNMIGNIETIDIKLGNIKRNVDELVDPDIYDNEQDKELVKILSEQGKNVGTVLSKIYGLVSGKPIELSETDKKIQARMGEIFQINNWTAADVKKIQDKVQPFSLITNMINKLEADKVDENIRELQKRLEPSVQIVEIFNRLDEEFKPESGAMALSKDLEYLESLVVKDDSKLTAEEKVEIQKYLDAIREKMKELELIFQKSKEYFEKIKKSSHGGEQSLLKDRLLEIEKIVYSENNESMIISRFTKDLNLIVENMRQCLGCLRKEANNDTNLAFGDYNKFFLMSQKEKQVGSIADEILFFAPIKSGAKPPEMSFIFDRVYGSKSPDILIAHVLTVYKTFKALKTQFKDANISLVISDNAMLSVGLDQELFQKKIKEKITDVKSFDYATDLVADIPASALSDNYIEFGGNNARASGERAFSGLVIK